MKISTLGLAIIETFEEFASKAYRHFPHEPWTCGYGHTGPDVSEGTVCTPQEASIWLAADANDAEVAISQYVKVMLTQHQFDALVSLIFNVGQGALEHRDGEIWIESTLLKSLEAGLITAAADEFLKWDHVGGVEDAGLLRRRKLERALFLDGIAA